MLGGDIRVLMTLDSNDFTVKTIKAGQVIQDLKRSIDRTADSTERLDKHFTGIGRKFHDVVRTASLLRYALHDIHDVFLSFPKAVLATSGEFERMTTLMQGMSKASDDFAKKAEALSNVKFMFNMAQKSPFDVKTLTDAFVKFKSAGIDPTNGSMQALIDSVARFGGTSETVHRASIAIQQMAGKGVISMEELRQQLGEAVPNAINLMAQGAGMSLQRFANKVKQGTVEATTSLNNMFAVMNFENAGSAAKMMDTWTGMLSLLKTKFELFKVDVGNAEFFGKAKDELGKLTDMFGGNAAKSFAYTLGQDLATLVSLVGKLVKAFIEWFDVIKLVAKGLLLYFAADKIGSLFSGIKSAFEKKAELYEKDIAKQQALKVQRLNDINEEIAAERAAFQKKVLAHNDLVASETAMSVRLRDEERKRIQAQRIANDEKLAEQVKHYNLMRAAQEKMLMEAMAAELQAEAAMRAKKAGSAAAARAAMADAGRLRSNAGVVGGEMATIQAEINALKQKEAALLAASAAANAAVTVNKRHAESAQILADHSRNLARMLQEKGIAATAAATGVTLLGRAMTGLKVVFDAFGGWVGMAIAVLVTLGQKLYDYMTRWQRFNDLVEQTKAGIYNKDTEEELNARMKEAQKSLKDARTALAQLEADGEDSVRSKERAKKFGFSKADGQADIQAYRTYLEGVVAQRLEEANKAERSFNEQKRLGREAETQRDNSQYRRDLDREMAEKTKDFSKRYSQLVKDEEEAVKAAREKAGKGGLTSLQENNVRAKFIEERNKIIQEQERTKYLYVAGESAKINALIQATNKPEELAALRAKQQILIDDLQKYANSITMASTLGVLNENKKEKNEKPVHPLARMLMEMEAGLAEAQMKLKATIDKTRDLDFLKQQTAMKILGDIAAGRFDVGEHNDERNATDRIKIGGEDRVTYVQKFIDFLKDGGKDIDAFLDKLDTLDNKMVIPNSGGLTARGIVKRAIQIGGETKADESGQKALTESRQIAEAAIVDLNAATARYAADGLAKEDVALRQVERRYARLEATMTEAQKNMKEYQDSKNEALKATATTSATNFAAESAAALRKATLEEKQLFADLDTQKKLAYQEEVDRIKLKYELERAAIIANIKDEKDRAEILKILDKGRTDAMDAAMKKLTVDLKTPLDRLQAQWNNSLDAMKQATANWANMTMDYIVKAINGEKVGKFKDVVLNMMKDLNGILIKKAIGGGITSLFGDIGKGVGDMLGLNGTPGASPANPMYTRDADKLAGQDILTKADNKLENMWDTLKDKLKGVWDWLKDGLGNVLKWIGDGFSMLISSLQGSGGGGGLLGGLSDLFGGGGGISDTGATGEMMDMFYAANGGVMTDMGPMSLVKYARGGVANSPQLAMFGEGAMPEAYVPLPDGRTIPVTMTGAGGNQNNVVINIQVNKDGTDSSSTSGEDENQTWQRVAQRVRGVVMEELVTQQRPGGVLYK